MSPEQYGMRQKLQLCYVSGLLVSIRVLSGQGSTLETLFIFPRSCVHTHTLWEQSDSALIWPSPDDT